MSATSEEVLTAMLMLDDLTKKTAGAAFAEFEVDSGELTRHAAKAATTALQDINLGEDALLALTTLYVQGTLLGLAIAECRGETVERLIEEAE